MVDQPVFSQTPPGATDPNEIIRDIQHVAVHQTSYPQVSYEAEDYQPQPSVATYTPPVTSSQPTLTPEPPSMSQPLPQAPLAPIQLTGQSAGQTPQATQPIQPAQPHQPPQYQAVPEPQPAPAYDYQEPVQPAPPSQHTEHHVKSEFFPGVIKPQPEEVVFEWESKSRPFKKRNRQYFTSIITIALLLSLILFFTGQFSPIAVVIAAAFFKYVSSVIPPGIVKHSLTTYGLRIEEQLYYWEELGRFWYTEKYGEKILHVEVARFPWRLTLLLGDVSEEEMTEILSEVLLKEKPKPTIIEKGATWLQEKFPLD